MVRIASWLPAALLAGGLAAQSAAAPCFEPSFGGNLHLGLDQVQVGTPLGFTFPGPAGPVSSISIGSNGFVWLGNNNDPACCDGSEQEFLAHMPRIAALWAGLDTAHGSVFFQTFPASGGAPARAVVTWDAPEQSGPGIHALVQLQLLGDGSVVVWHGPDTHVVAHACLVGITSGNNATPDLVDFSTLAAGPFDTGTNPTVYDLMPFVFGQETYDLTGHSYEFVPNGRGGYVCRERLTCRSAAFTTFGAGCPQPPTFYEVFAPGTFDLANQSLLVLPNGLGGWAGVPGGSPLLPASNRLPIFQDQIATGVALPFSWSHPAGSTSMIDVDSNGCVYPQSGVFQTSRAMDGDPRVFLREPPSIAVLWQPLHLDLLTGAVCFDVDPTGQIAYVTWANVAEAGSTQLFTVQMQFRASGGYELVYGGVTNNGHTALVGYSMGNFAHDPGSRDLSALPWNLGANAPPLTLSALPGSRPVIGSQFGLQVANITAASPLGFLVVGVQRAAIDLASLGAEGCTGYVDYTLPGGSVFNAFVASGPSANLALGVPNAVSLVGVELQAQAAALAPGFNLLGVIASNGGTLLLGR